MFTPYQLPLEQLSPFMTKGLIEMAQIDLNKVVILSVILGYFFLIW